MRKDKENNVKENKKIDNKFKKDNQYKSVKNKQAEAGKSKDKVEENSLKDLKNKESQQFKSSGGRNVKQGESVKL
mgnify:CR=1 FL=1